MSSYRYIRNFCDIMRTLKYPRTISMNNFLTPNIVLILEIILWLLQRIDINRNCNMSIMITSKDKATIIKYACEQFYSNLHIKLSPMILYRADSSSIRELFKVINVLIQSRKYIMSNAYGDIDNNGSKGLVLSDMQLNTVNNIVIISNEISECGTNVIIIVYHLY